MSNLIKKCILRTLECKNIAKVLDKTNTKIKDSVDVGFGNNLVTRPTPSEIKKNKYLLINGLRDSRNVSKNGS